MSADCVMAAAGITKSYGKIAVLKSVDIALRRGETHAVIGPNGAGKTTLFKVLSGEVFAEAGSVLFESRRVDGLDGWRRVRSGIGRTFQVARVFGEQTVLANMIVAIEARRRRSLLGSILDLRLKPETAVTQEALAELERMGLAGHRDRAAGVLAYGDRKRLELAMCLSLRPSLLMLDEPMAGMSPVDRTAAVDLIRQVTREREISVLLTEHDMDVVFALAQRITVLNYGEVIASGAPDEVRATPRVRDVYLGHGVQHA